ncbi:TPA: hypothetical protein ACMDS2_004281 [Vibrio parahaemolyticus]|uniref:hypothetical protein n=1 Tax=Vibrio diabolicus TaxID=50719 RepID=UPI00211C92D7|nr:hypothetical protein [Vibrio diabolicus]EGQ8547878.1 hypothetical protein [Vibrio parahaemolyticus]MCQ9247819.1 hypothetical protein [Vibrio diabolicus]
MAKVFAVIENEHRLELLSWSSGKAFTASGQSWLDDKFICIATTDDHKNRGLFAEFKLCERSLKGFSSSIVKSEKELLANDIMALAFAKHFNQNVSHEARKAIELAIKSTIMNEQSLKKGGKVVSNSI